MLLKLKYVVLQITFSLFNFHQANQADWNSFLFNISWTSLPLLWLSRYTTLDQCYNLVPNSVKLLLTNKYEGNK